MFQEINESNTGPNNSTSNGKAWSGFNQSSRPTRLPNRLVTFVHNSDFLIFTQRRFHNAVHGNVTERIKFNAFHILTPSNDPPVNSAQNVLIRIYT